MKKTAILFLSTFLVVVGLSACNMDNNEGAQDYKNRNNFLTGDDVNYHTGNSRTNADGKQARSIISKKPSGHQEQRIMIKHQQNKQSQNQQGQNQSATPGKDGDIDQGQAARPGSNNNQGNTAAEPGTAGQTGQAASSDIVNQVVELTNQERAKTGLGPLLADYDQLQEAAQMKSNDMSQNNYFSHSSPTYGSPFQMLKDLGIEYQVATENIAAGQKSAQEVVKSWMNSPGHRENIMNKEITHIGVGYAASGSYWTQLFIKK